MSFPIVLQIAYDRHAALKKDRLQSKQKFYFWLIDDFCFEHSTVILSTSMQNQLILIFLVFFNFKVKNNKSLRSATKLQNQNSSLPLVQRSHKYVLITINFPFLPLSPHSISIKHQHQVASSLNKLIWNSMLAVN